VALPDPQLNARGVEDVLLIAVEGGHQLASPEILPADRTLFPQFFIRLSLLFAAEGCLV